MCKNGEVIESGVTSPSTRPKVEPEVRISHLIGSLNVLASQWQTQIVALRQPSSINWPVPALDLLASSLLEWSTERGHPQFSHTRSGSTCGHRRALQRLPRPVGVRHYAAIGVDRPRKVAPRVGGHSGGPLSPNAKQLKSPLPYIRELGWGGDLPGNHAPVRFQSNHASAPPIQGKPSHLR